MATTAERVPLHRPYLSGREHRYFADALARGHHHGDGPFTERCHQVLKRLTGADHALLTTSCTTALEMSALLAQPRERGADPGEVVVPSFTFVTSANAFVTHGYKPVFAEVREDTKNLDERKLEQFITDRTRAIVVIHYAGVPAEMDAIREIAAARNIAVVEDAAHALGAQHRGRPVGSLADFGTFSFHGTKNISCGEGGCLTVMDREAADRAEIIREKGTNRRQFIEGRVDKYNWVDIGGSFLPSDLLAAVLLAQLEDIDKIQSLRKARFERYQDGLADLESTGRLQRPVVPEHCEAAYHLYFVQLRDRDERIAMTQFLREAGIESAFHYPSLHLSPMGRTLGGEPGTLPVSEWVSEGLLRLPFYSDLEVEQVDRVLEAVHAFFERGS